MAKDKTKSIQKMVAPKASKQSANKVCEVVAAAEGRMWQARRLPPLARANAAEEVSHLLALLNGAELELATTGGAWRCRARQIFFPEKNATKNVAKNIAKNTNETLANIGERVPSQGRWSLLLSLGDTPCLCRLDLPANLRASLETMSAPYKLEELPSSVALGLLSLALSPLLREIFLGAHRLVEHGIGVEKKLCSKEEVAFLIEALPIKQGGTDEGAEEDSLQLQVFLATRDLAAFARSLRIARQSRSYPPNLHTTWQLDGGETSLSLEEFRALKEGDVLLLS